MANWRLGLGTRNNVGQRAGHQSGGAGLLLPAWMSRKCGGGVRPSITTHHHSIATTRQKPQPMNGASGVTQPVISVDHLSKLEFVALLLMGIRFPQLFDDPIPCHHNFNSLAHERKLGKKEQKGSKSPPNHVIVNQVTTMKVVSLLLLFLLLFLIGRAATAGLHLLTSHSLPCDKRRVTAKCHARWCVQIAIDRDPNIEAIGSSLTT